MPHLVPEGGAAVIEFHVRGTPAPGGSKTAVAVRRGNGSIVMKGNRPVLRYIDDGKGNKKWREDVEHYARRAYTGAPLVGPLRLVVEFRMPRPAKHFVGGRKDGELRAAFVGIEHAQKPDTTKLLRSTEDALSGIVWVDDAQVVEQYATKRWANHGELVGARIRITKVERGTKAS